MKNLFSSIKEKISTTLKNSDEDIKYSEENGEDYLEIDTAHDAGTKTKIVARIAAIAFPASPGAPPASDLIKTQITPIGACPVPNANVPALVNGEKALTNSCCDTPAAMNKLTPEPKPHLLITSSI